MPVVIFCSCPDETSANTIAGQLVKKHLAACVNIIANISSVFRWENQIEKTSEYLLLIKSTEENYAGIEAFIKSQHPYKTPEIIALPIIKGSKDYLEWLSEATRVQ